MKRKRENYLTLIVETKSPKQIVQPRRPVRPQVLKQALQARPPPLQVSHTTTLRWVLQKAPWPLCAHKSSGSFHPCNSKIPRGLNMSFVWVHTQRVWVRSVGEQSRAPLMMLLQKQSKTQGGKLRRQDSPLKDVHVQLQYPLPPARFHLSVSLFR